MMTMAMGNNDNNVNGNSATGDKIDDDGDGENCIAAATACSHRMPPRQLRNYCLCSSSGSSGGSSSGL